MLNQIIQIWSKCNDLFVIIITFQAQNFSITTHNAPRYTFVGLTIKFVVAVVALNTSLIPRCNGPICYALKPLLSRHTLKIWCCLIYNILNLLIVIVNGQENVGFEFFFFFFFFAVTYKKWIIIIFDILSFLLRCDTIICFTIAGSHAWSMFDMIQ